MASDSGVPGTGDVAPLQVGEALARMRANPASQWPARGEANRLEPECWPEIRPSFRIARGARVFTIGSCFARNIETHLAGMGFDVPAVALVAAQPGIFARNGAELLNKYTPTSILQELEWALRIRERDDTVHASDVLPLLYSLGPDRYIDLHTRADPGFGFPLEQQLARRRAIYTLAREAFDCDLAVVTLGLIETWWDLETGQTVEFHPALARHAQPGRYVFRRLTYQEAHDAIARSLSLLLRNPRTHVLLTTSPVPLNRTFMPDDVIVANTYSKSLLRTVAGAVTEAFDRVDYFPSYESVMLTRSPGIWLNDLTHIDRGFVGRIMARVVSHYVDEAEDFSGYARALAFVDLVERGDWAAAQAEYTHFDAADLALAPHTLRVAMAECALRAGDAARARVHLEAALAGEGPAGPLSPDSLWRVAGCFERLGDAGAARATRARVLLQHGQNELAVRSLVSRWRQNGQLEAAAWLAAEAERSFVDNAFVLGFLAGIHAEDGRSADAERLYRAAIALGADAATHLRFSALLVDAGREGEAIEVLSTALGRDPTQAVVVRLAHLLGKQGRLVDAEQVLAGHLAHTPDDPLALGQLARVLARQRRTGEALDAVRRAVALGNTAPAVLALRDRLEGGPARA